MWYEPYEFQKELQKMGVSVATCAERQCVDALRWTSDYVGRRYSEAYKAGLVQYAGPQCFPQLKDPVRLQANSQFASKKKTGKASAKGSRADTDAGMSSRILNFSYSIAGFVATSVELVVW